MLIQNFRLFLLLSNWLEHCLRQLINTVIDVASVFASYFRWSYFTCCFHRWCFSNDCAGGH